VTEVVVDASVAAMWVVEEDHSANAALLLDYQKLHAPSHWRAEAVNVLWAKVFRGDLTAEDAEERMLVLNRAPVMDSVIAGLMPRAFAISLVHVITVYDSLYVALAEELDIPFVTADQKLIRRLAGDANLGKRMVWVGGISGA
jgi:predicted nucleic acid-binding protein